MKSAQIRFSRFWPSFDKEENFFLELLREETFDNRIEISSVFPQSVDRFASASKKILGIMGVDKLISRPSRKIWFTGENIRPPFGDEYDGYISFDQDALFGKNLYFPLLYLEILFRDRQWTNRLGTGFDSESLQFPRTLRREKTKFACAFIGNPDPTRLRAIQALQRHGQVDVFGPYSGIPVSGKFEIAKDYKYMVCFENDLFPGYLTEKLLDAYVCETVPLYWGDFGREPHVNKNSLINAANFESIEQFASFVSRIDTAAYEFIYNQPLMNSLPSADSLRRHILGKSD